MEFEFKSPRVDLNNNAWICNEKFKSTRDDFKAYAWNLKHVDVDFKITSSTRPLHLHLPLHLSRLYLSLSLYFRLSRPPVASSLSSLVCCSFVARLLLVHPCFSFRPIHLILLKKGAKGRKRKGKLERKGDKGETSGKGNRKRKTEKIEIKRWGERIMRKGE